MHREVFLAHNGPGPWACFGCEEDVVFETAFHVHHVDEDDRNNDPINLMAMHSSCHTRLHQTGRPAWNAGQDTPESVRLKMSASADERWSREGERDRGSVLQARRWESDPRRVRVLNTCMNPACGVVFEDNCARVYCSRACRYAAFTHSSDTKARIAESMREARKQQSA